MSIRKEAAFVAHLTRLTKDGELTWARMEPPPSLTHGTSCQVLEFYETKLEGRNIGLYEIRIPTYDGDRDTWHWHSERELALFDLLGNHEYTFGANAGIFELFAEVKRNVAGVDEYLDQVLGKGAEQSK